MRATSLILLAFLLSCGLASVPAWSSQTGVFVDPQSAFMGTEVRIFGYVKPEAGQTIVRIELIPPAPHGNINRDVTATRDGRFELIFKETGTPGTWHVRAKKKTGDATSAETTFVITTGIFAKDTTTELKKVNQITLKGGGDFQGVLTGYPDFAGKDKMLREIEDVLTSTEAMARQLEAVAQAARHLEEQLRLHHDGLPREAAQALQNAAGSGRNAATAISEQLPPIRAALESTKESAEWCHVWLGYHEFSSLLGTLNNFIATSFKDIAANLGLAASTSNLHPAVQQAIQTYFHLVTTASPSVLGFATYMTGTLASLATDTYEQLMKTCTYYKGSVEGDYRLALEHKGKPFFVMSYRLESEMWLSFEARNPGDPAVHLRGRLRGKAHDFTCDLTMDPFALPGTVAPAFCHCPVPPLSSRGFLFYFTGKAMDNKMELELEKVHSDFNLKAVGFYVLLSAHIVGLEADFLEFPLMDAEWFLTRTTKLSQPGNDHFTLNIRPEGERSVAGETFTREIYLPPTSKRKAVRANMTMKFHICSPECESK